MGKLRFLLFFFFLLISGVTRTEAQSLQPDSAFLQRAVQYLTVTYHQVRAGDSPLYNGTEYVSSDKDYLIGHPGFLVDTMVNGTVFYDGNLYQDVPMLYDVREDQLVIYNLNTNFKMKLIKEKVRYFELQRHTFKQYLADTIPAAPIASGFYDVLHQGSINFLVKRIKMITESVQNRSLTGEYLSSTKFYIQKNNQYYPVKSKRSVVKVLGVQKSLLQKQLRADRVKYRKNRENAIYKLVHYYDDQLKK